MLGVPLAFAREQLVPGLALVSAGRRWG